SHLLDFLQHLVKTCGEISLFTQIDFEIIEQRRIVCGRLVAARVRIDDCSMEEAIREIAVAAEEKRSLRIAFANPDCLNIAWSDRDYTRALETADRVYADGIGLRIAARWTNRPLRDNVNGTDMFPRLCRQARRRGLSLFLLGARPGVAERAARLMCERFPGLKIAGTRDGYFSSREEAEVCAEIRRSGADLVLVGLGAPRQDLWLQRHRAELGDAVLMGVGGLFDFYSGRISRAPAAWRELGLEWLWRLKQEPKRLWRRYLVGNPLFLWRVLCSRRQRRADCGPQHPDFSEKSFPGRVPS
ncbi:MAG: WecB/TagA/CpsF family glycosyltransferase, partial [Holophagales bacterium]|nr:WecB/TagA/CpsF family glycosyltransferase [Holophagales bacterium]